MTFVGLRFMMSRYLFVLWCMGCANLAQAEIYKSIDAEGHVTYSSTPSKGAKKLGLEPLVPRSHPSRESSSHSPRARSNPSPYDFPRVDSGTQKSRDNIRYRILSDELSSEEKLLAEARAAQKAGEVTLHEKNISALKTELSHLK